MEAHRNPASIVDNWSGCSGVAMHFPKPGSLTRKRRLGWTHHEALAEASQVGGGASTGGFGCQELGISVPSLLVDVGGEPVNYGEFLRPVLLMTHHDSTLTSHSGSSELLYLMLWGLGSMTRINRTDFCLWISLGPWKFGTTKTPTFFWVR